MKKNNKNKSKKYSLYPPLYKMVEKKNKQINGKSATAWNGLKSFFKQAGQIDAADTIMNYKRVANEYHWAKQGSKTIFIEDIETVNRLINSKYNINDISEELLPFEAFTISPPKDFEVNGIQPSGILVNICHEHKMHSKIFSKFDNEINSPISSQYPPCPADNSRIVISLSYKTNKDVAYNFSEFKSDNILEIINAKSITKYKELVKNFEGITDIRSDMNEEESELAQTLIRMVVGLGIFIKAKPDSLVDGLPSINISQSSMPEQGTKKYSFKPTKLTTNSVESHYRNWYIRQLSHPKYYQNEHKNKTTGSRFVFVKDTIVNETTTPMHIEPTR
jgi:hypothetical protein